jgi:hypothetical protein
MVVAQLNRALQCTAVRIASANVQDRRHPGIASALDDIFTIRVKLRTINVCV